MRLEFTEEEARLIAANADGWLDAGAGEGGLEPEEKDALRKLCEQIRSGGVKHRNARKSTADKAQRADPLRAAVEAIVGMLEEGEWAEHVAATTGQGDPLAQRLEDAITELHNEARADELTELELCTFCGVEVETACNAPPANTCEKALDAQRDKEPT